MPLPLPLPLVELVGLTVVLTVPFMAVPLIFICICIGPLLLLLPSIAAVVYPVATVVTVSAATTAMRYVSASNSVAHIIEQRNALDPFCTSPETARQTDRMYLLVFCVWSAIYNLQYSHRIIGLLWPTTTAASTRHVAEPIPARVQPK